MKANVILQAIREMFAQIRGVAVEPLERSPNELFERTLAVPEEDIEFFLRGHLPAPWSDFVLNPRRLRGSDFLMRWSQGQWSEERLKQAVNNSGDYGAIPYGPSGVAPSGDPRAFELYFERLEAAGLDDQKRPDLLIFYKREVAQVDAFVKKIGGYAELPFTPERDLQAILDRAILGIECENSLWKAQAMPDFGKDMTPQKRLGGRPGYKKGAVLPTIIVKEEDREPLAKWQKGNKIPIHIWHAFFDMAYGISFDRFQELLQEGLIQPTEQVFQAPGGATTTKVIYKVYHDYAYKVGANVEEATLKADCLVDRNGHVLPYVRFAGGRMNLDPQAIAALREVKRVR